VASAQLARETGFRLCYSRGGAAKDRVYLDHWWLLCSFNLASRCAMCLEEEESVDHLFLHCQWVSSLWLLSLSLMGVSWVQPSNVKAVLVAWRRRLKKSRVHGIWKLVPLLFGGVLGKRGTHRFLKAKLLTFRILSSIF